MAPHETERQEIHDVIQGVVSIVDAGGDQQSIDSVLRTVEQVYEHFGVSLQAWHQRDAAMATLIALHVVEKTFNCTTDQAIGMIGSIIRYREDNDH